MWKEIAQFKIDMDFGHLEFKGMQRPLGKS